MKDYGFFVVYLEQVKGIEPSQLAWKAKVLPLNYTCKITWAGML